MMIRHLLNSGKKRGLLIVPTINLVTQMHSDFKNYSSNNGWDVDKYCQKIFGGESKIPDTDLIISTWQSIYDMPKKYFAQFDFIIGDEAHTFKAKSMAGMTGVKADTFDYDSGLTIRPRGYNQVIFVDFE